MQRLIKSPVLITGEAGIGQELCAKVIHQASLRQNQAFMTINYARLPYQLLESKLFGYTKGAFVGTESRKNHLGHSA